jgi:hypothetical protein
MSENTELALTSTMTIGKLETNALQIKAAVIKKLEGYTPENYAGRIAEAKRDKAELNAAEKLLNSRRLELEREFMRPFVTFKETITETCKAIKEASAKIDAVVKEVENREKEQKRAEIRAIWEKQGFTLYDLDRIFDQRWLNKSYKIKDIEGEIIAAINRALGDLKVIEALPAEDVPLIKMVYLDTLSIADAMTRANQLKENRERLAREQQERQRQAINAQVEQQRQEEKQEAREQVAAEKVDNLAAAALEIEQEPTAELHTFALVLTGTKEDLLLVRKYMTSLGVTYTKLQETPEGTYTT